MRPLSRIRSLAPRLAALVAPALVACHDPLTPTAAGPSPQDGVSRMARSPGTPRFAAGVTGRPLQLHFQHLTAGLPYNLMYTLTQTGGYLGTDTYGDIGSGWTLAGTGDFSGDGQGDMLWQNDASGALFAWTINGSDVRGATIELPSAPSPWKVAAVGDLDGDGDADLVWRHPPSGTIVVWIMAGTTFQSSATLGGPPAEWRLAAAGDIDGDGRADLLWENTQNGAHSAWLMNGTNRLGYLEFPVVPTEWRIAAVADYDDDGKNDVLWQQASTGQIVVWRMNGTTYLGTVWHGGPTGWTLKAARRSGSSAPTPRNLSVDAWTIVLDHALPSSFTIDDKWPPRVCSTVEYPTTPRSSGRPLPQFPFRWSTPVRSPAALVVTDAPPAYGTTDVTDCVYLTAQSVAVVPLTQSVIAPDGNVGATRTYTVTTEMTVKSFVILDPVPAQGPAGSTVSVFVQARDANGLAVPNALVKVSISPATLGDCSVRGGTGAEVSGGLSFRTNSQGIIGLYLTLQSTPRTCYIDVQAYWLHQQNGSYDWTTQTTLAVVGQ